MTDGKIFIGADHDLLFEGVRDRDCNYLNDGDCSYELTDDEGAPVVGGSGTLDYVPGSDGDYRATIDASVTVTLGEGRVYFLNVTFAQDGYDDYRRERLTAFYRHGDE